MNRSAAVFIPAPVRRMVRWAVIGFGICLVPFAIFALVVAGYLGLNREASALRKEIFAATPEGWSTKIEVNLGHSTLGAVELGLRFVEDGKLAQAREILANLQSASVGVYRHKNISAGWSRPELLLKTDRMMAKRGWIRAVGVVDSTSTVAVYSPAGSITESWMEVCVAVINDQDLVVAAAKLNPKVIDGLIKTQPWDKLHETAFLSAP